MTVHVALAGFGVAFPRLAGYRMVSPFSDLEVYVVYANLMAKGLWPYLGFVVEYPPLAVPLMGIPRLVSASGAGWLGPFGAYVAGFVVEMLLVDAAAVWVVARATARAEGVRRVPVVLAWYSAYFAALCPLVVVRFDLAPMLLGFAAATALARGRAGLGGTLAGLGVLVKAVPVLVLVPYLMGDGPIRTRGRAVWSAGLVVGAGVLGCLALGGARTVESVRYHTDRGIEIGSTYASGFMVAHEVAGLPIAQVYDRVSINVVAPWADGAARASVVVQVALLAAVARRARRLGREASIPLAGAALLAYILGGKVLSPQYLIWLIPFVAASGVGRRTFLACCLLTTAVYPWSFAALCHFRPWAEALLLARNVALGGLFVMLLRVDRGTAGG